MKTDKSLIFRRNLKRLLEREWLSQREAAERFDVSYKWFRRLVHHGLKRSDRRTEASLRSIAEHLGLEMADLWCSELENRLAPLTGQVLVKWTGSKRRQAAEIVQRFPKTIRTYHEPFVGGGSVLYELLSSGIECERIRCSDTCRPLIELWRIVKDDPRHLNEEYGRLWHELGGRGATFYLEVRDEFNETGDPCLFFFLLRTCRNGMVRFNKAGQFSTGFHHGRRGMRPEKVKSVVEDWSRKLRQHDVRFYVRDYRRITSEDGDLLYLDPPYKVNVRHAFYSGVIDFEQFFHWLGKQQGDYLLSLNGLRGGEDWTVDVPNGLYDEHTFVPAGRSSLAQLNGNRACEVKDSLYVRVPTNN